MRLSQRREPVHNRLDELKAVVAKPPRALG